MRSCMPEAGVWGGTSNYIPQILWGVIIFPSPQSLLLAHKYLIDPLIWVQYDSLGLRCRKREICVIDTKISRPVTILLKMAILILEEILYVFVQPLHIRYYLLLNVDVYVKLGPSPFTWMFCELHNVTIYIWWNSNKPYFTVDFTLSLVYYPIEA